MQPGCEIYSTELIRDLWNDDGSASDDMITVLNTADTVTLSA